MRKIYNESELTLIEGAQTVRLGISTIRHLVSAGNKMAKSLDDDMDYSVKLTSTRKKMELAVEERNLSYFCTDNGLSHETYGLSKPPANSPTGNANTNGNTEGTTED